MEGSRFGDRTHVATAKSKIPCAQLEGDDTALAWCQADPSEALELQVSVFLDDQVYSQNDSVVTKMGI